MILRKAHVGKEGSEPSSHITLAPERCDSGVILLALICMCCGAPPTNAAAKCETVDKVIRCAPVEQQERVVTWKAQADKAMAKDRDEAQCRAVAPHVADHTGKSTDTAMAECMKRRQP